MVKIVQIDGKNVPFEKNGGTMRRYKMQTGREFYSDVSAFLGILDADENGKIVKDISEVKALKIMTTAEFDYMYDVLHIMARSADKNVPADQLEWLESFEDFPVIQIFMELLPMLLEEMKVSRKNV